MSIILIALFIILMSHLKVDKSFPQEVKTTSGAIFWLVAILYVFFGLAF